MWLWNHFQTTWHGLEGKIQNFIDFNFFVLKFVNSQKKKYDYSLNGVEELNRFSNDLKKYS